MVFIPTSRDSSIDGADRGAGRHRRRQRHRSRPSGRSWSTSRFPRRTDVSEIVVTGSGRAGNRHVADLSGKQVAVREQSIQFESLVALNATLKTQGKAPIAIKTVPPALEDEDILEMTNSGLVKADRHRRPCAPILEADPARHHAPLRRGRARGRRYRPGRSARTVPKLIAVAEPVRPRPTGGHLVRQRAVRST